VLSFLAGTGPEQPSVGGGKSGDVFRARISQDAGDKDWPNPSRVRGCSWAPRTREQKGRAHASAWRASFFWAKAPERPRIAPADRPRCRLALQQSTIGYVSSLNYLWISALGDSRCRATLGGKHSQCFRLGCANSALRHRERKAIAALVAVAIIGGARLLGTRIGGTFNNVSNAIK
jgi:hypothetical protein